MSHISTYSAKITNRKLFLQVCEKKGCTVKTGKQWVNQFGSNAVEAIASIKMPGWRYDIALTEQGELKYDNWGSESISMDTLGQTIQDYNEIGIYQEAPMDKIQNYGVEQMKNGDRKLVLEFA